MRFAADFGAFLVPLGLLGALCGRGDGAGDSVGLVVSESCVARIYSWAEGSRWSSTPLIWER